MCKEQDYIIEKMKMILLLLVYLVLIASNVAGTKLTTYIQNTTIIAFGDSLTEGLYKDGRRWLFHGYPKKTESLLNNDNLDVAVINRGKSGRKTYEMIDMMSIALEKSLKHQRRLSLVLIMGGTNDLVIKATPEDILGNLIKLHQMAHLVHPESPVYTIALAIPVVEWPINQTARTVVNAGLRQYVQSCSHRVAYLDFDVQFPRSNNSLWSDGAHFTSLGYDALGTYIYDFIRQTSFESPYNTSQC